MTNDEEAKTKRTTKESVKIKPDKELQVYVHKKIDISRLKKNNG